MSRLILSEKTGRWAAGFRCAAPDLPIVETRSGEQALRELETYPASLVAVEVTVAAAVPVMRRWGQLPQHFPLARWLALADESLADAEPFLREAGAVHVALSSRDLAAAVRIVRRHLARAPAPQCSLEESILQSLPWPAGS